MESNWDILSQAQSEQLGDTVKNEELSPLIAVSPLDGRYNRHSKGLRDYFSEFALIKYRVIVEIQWFSAMIKEGITKEQFECGPETVNHLKEIITKFSVEDAKRVKEIERTTNHDVKAVEYFLKEQFDKIETLKDKKEFLHFTCTSEDINNLSYAMMIQTALSEVLFPVLEKLLNNMNEFA